MPVKYQKREREREREGGRGRGRERERVHTDLAPSIRMLKQLLEYANQQSII